MCAKSERENKKGWRNARRVAQNCGIEYFVACQAAIIDGPHDAFAAFPPPVCHFSALKQLRQKSAVHWAINRSSLTHFTRAETVEWPLIGLWHLVNDLSSTSGP